MLVAMPPAKYTFLIFPVVFLVLSVKFWADYAKDGRTQTLIAALGCTAALVAGIVTSLRSLKKSN